MRVRNQWFRLMAPEDDKGGGGGGGDPPPAGDPPAADPPPSGETPPAGDPPAPAASTWPDDWRNQIANGDEKIASKLSRYSSPKDVANALLSVQSKIGAGELRSVLPKNATEEQVKLWREENGIPESPDKYELKLADGLVVGADDKPLIDNLLKSMHKVNAPAGIASEVVNFYYAQIEAQEADRQQKDSAAAREATDALHAEWGAEFRPNMNMIEGLLDTAPAGVKDLIKFGRLSDGTPIMANADAIRWLNNMAREINPVTTLLPNSGSNISGAIDDEIKKIETNMGAPKGTPAHKAYWNDEKAQSRYRELLDARDRAKKKAA